MKPLDPARPFVLLDDARPGATQPARLYREPIAEISAHAPSDITPAFARLRAAVQAGHHVAGYIGYEAGLVLEPRLERLLRPMSDAQPPLLWFGVFAEVELVERATLEWLLGDPAGAWAGQPRPRLSQAEHEDAVGTILNLIAAGDIYQANLSFRADVAVAGSPIALYARLRKAGGGGWGGIVRDRDRWLLSCSPELFFTAEDGRLTARPMKGTAPVAEDPEVLRGDTKQRAENLMIVDLLRNDLSRVAVAGSVAVPALFEVETYPTVHQMTSTVTAELAADRDAIDVLEAIFPCGSVTGAPKIRAMEVIAAQERDARDVYTGSIGSIAPDGNAAFNVAIRTLMIPVGSHTGVLGLGSAIVADSAALAEWRECLAKGAFVTAAAAPFDLIETMRFDATEGLTALDRHIARLKASADQFGFPFDRHALRNDLQAATFRLRTDYRVRVRLSPTGAIAIEVCPLPETPPRVEVALAPCPVAAGDFRLAHKTSDRDFYDRTRQESGAFEVVYVDAEGFLTEGSFTSIFVARNGALATPPLARGLLPGVLRGQLIDKGEAFEADVRPEDLKDGFFVGNALRGLIPARLVAGAKGPRL